MADGPSTPPKMPPPSPPPSKATSVVNLLLEGEEEEQGFVEDQVVEPWENPEFLRECLKCHCRLYLRKGGCCNPACAPCFSICTYESFNRRQNLVSLSFVVAFRVFICCFCLSHAQALYYVHRKDWAYWQKGKSAKKSWTGDKQGMVKCIVASGKKKSLAMKEAKKALAAVHKTHGKRVRKSKNKGLKKKVFWARRATRGAASEPPTSTSQSGTQYAVALKAACQN